MEDERFQNTGYIELTIIHLMDSECCRAKTYELSILVLSAWHATCGEGFSHDAAHVPDGLLRTSGA